MKTRGIRYKDRGGLEVIEMDVPDPEPGEVQVRGTMCGICAWDLYTFQRGACAPYAGPPGHEAIGYVAQLGQGVSGFEVGQRVVSPGGFAGLCNVNANQVYRLPSTELADEHWLVEPVSCAVTGMDHCDLHAGDRVALVGCGFMGLLLLQCLVHSTAGHVIALDVNPRRLDMARKLGADLALNPADEGFDDHLEALQNLRIDTVVDASGAQAGLDLAGKMVRRGGRINLFGWIHGQATFPGDEWHLGGYTVVCSSPSARIRDTIPPAIRLLETGVVNTRPLVTHVVSLDGMAALLGRVVQGEEPEYIKGVVQLA